MKNTLAILSWLLLGLNGFGQLANLVIFTELEENFSLTIDGQRVNRLPTRNLKVTGLEGGSLPIQVQFANPMLPNVIERVQVVPGRELTLALAKDMEGTVRIKFVNEFALDFVPVPPANQSIVSFGGGSVVQNSQQLTTPGLVPQNQLVNPQQNAQNLPSEPTPPNPLPGYAGKLGCDQPMSKEDFENAKQSIASKSFSDTKLQVAKQVARDGCLMTSQVLEVMALLTFDTDKLSFAKEAYDHTYDQGNYYKINSGFGYESTIRELEQYLKGK